MRRDGVAGAVNVAREERSGLRLCMVDGRDEGAGSGGASHECGVGLVKGLRSEARRRLGQIDDVGYEAIRKVEVGLGLGPRRR